MGGWPSPQSGVPDSCLVLPCSGESPAPGTVSPQSKFYLRENGTPQVRVARNPARVRRVVPPSRLTASTRQEFRQSSFHFSERTFCQVPLRVQAISPFRRKPRDPWGPSAWQKTRSRLGESKPWAKNGKVAGLNSMLWVWASQQVWDVMTSSSKSACSVIAKKKWQKRESNACLLLKKQCPTRLFYHLHQLIRSTKVFINPFLVIWFWIVSE